MELFFRIKERQEGLRLECERWKGTPFMPRSSAAGYGVDCVNFVQSVCYNIGVISDKYQMPEYKMDWHRHNDHSMLQDFVRRHHSKSFLELDGGFGDLMIGDVVGIIPTGRCIHHVGIYHKDNRIIHAIAKKGVIESSTTGSTFGMTVGKIFRPIE